MIETTTGLLLQEVCWEEGTGVMIGKVIVLMGATLGSLYYLVMGCNLIRL